MESYISEPYLAAIVGGLLIGAAASLLLIFNGEIAGISGILYRALSQPLKSRWQLSFLAGLLSGGVCFLILSPDKLSNSLTTPIPVLVIAGWLVGFGTRLGGGCTSGHGVCGVSRLSIRSIFATITFLAIGFITATLVGKLRLF